MRKKFKKLKHRVTNYRSYKHFSNEVINYKNCINRRLSMKITGLNFCNNTLKTLDKDAPRKAKYARDNQMLFMAKDLSNNIRKFFGKQESLHYTKNSMLGEDKFE